MYASSRDMITALGVASLSLLDIKESEEDAPGELLEGERGYLNTISSVTVYRH